MLNLSPDRIASRMQLVERHVAFENVHDLDGVLSTFGPDARYEDTPWNDTRIGRDQVRAYYADIMHAVPDLQIDVKHCHVTGENIVLEVVIRGHQQASWRGLPATGRRVEVPLCGIYSFDDADRLRGERIYYDRALVLRQLGVFHDPQTVLGRALTALTHPFTMARIAFKALRRGRR